MALSVEQKKDILKDSVEWFSFTDQQHSFLLFCAEGMPFAEACKKAYPNSNGKSVRGTVALLLTKPFIRVALESIGIVSKKPLKTRQDVLQIVSDVMDEAEDNDQLLKFINTFAKLSGWEKVTTAVDDEPSLDEQVAAAEKERKKNGKEKSTEEGQEQRRVV